MSERPTVEWIGGPEDGHRFEVPADADFVEVARHTSQLMTAGGLYDQDDVMLVEIVKKRNGRWFIHWREC